MALVTGGSGFLGRYIVEKLLERGDRVRTLCRRHNGHLQKIGAEQFVGDIRERDTLASACADVEVVYHVAAVAGIWGPWGYYHSINTQGTENLIAACRRTGVGKLIYTSSPSVTFNGSPQEGVDEAAPYAERWLCHYPHTKALAEKMVLKANDQRGLLTCSLRPHLIWGPHDRHLIPRVLDRARRGQLRRVGDGNNLIDMVYVGNAADAHLQAADALCPHSPVAGQAYFISQGEPVNCWDWINDVVRLAELPEVNKSISFKTAWRLGATLETIHRTLRLKAEPRMTRFLAAQLGHSHYFNINRAKLDFGYSAQISTREGMKLLEKAIQDGDVGTKED